MRHIVATIGAVFMFVVVFLITAIAVAFGPAWLHPKVTVGPFWTNHPYGTLLATIAAIHSFRATLRHYAVKQVVSRDSDSNVA